jgi:tetratricopeptide (TPR) repeat protein
VDFVGSVIEHRFELGPLVFAGLRETSTLEMLAPLLDEPEPQAVQLGPQFARFRADFEAVFGGELTALLQTGCDLGSLVMRPDASALVYALEALLLAGMASVTASATASMSAPQSGAVERPLSGAESSKLPLADAWQVDTQPELRPAEPAPETARPARAPTTDPSLPRDVMREFLEVHGRTPQEVLGVRPNASKAELDRTLAAKRARLLGLGPVGPHQGLIDELLEAYTRAHAALDNPTRPDPRRATALYGAVPDDPAMDPLGAELAFGQGRALMAAGAVDQAIPHFRNAVDKRPDQAAYHAFLGWALFHVHGQQAMPEALDRLEHAVAVDPDSAEAHALLAGLLTALGDPRRARQHLERTLVLRPEQPDSIELLARLYVENGDPELAEKLYRRVLAALGERELPLRRTLWRELAELYEGPLMDTTSAARAYAVAAHLDPGDPSLPKKAAAALTAGIARGEVLE